MSKPLLRRNRAPIGGKSRLVVVPAWWRAGQRKCVCVRVMVKRIGWSSWSPTDLVERSRSGKTGRPAASADLQPFGRIAYELRSNVAPDSAVQLVLMRRAPPIS